MTLRYCLPRVSRQGRGLADELVPWARAFLAAQVLGATLLPPPGRPDRRWIFHRAAERLLPRVEFKEADYLEHGGGDVVTALSRFARARGLQERAAFVLRTEGVWGGLQHVQAARAFMRSLLYRRRYVASNLLRLRERTEPQKILVALHLRPGDLGVSPPLDWLRRVAQTLRAALADEVQFLLVSECAFPLPEPLCGEIPCIRTTGLPPSECSDVLALAQADLLIGSASAHARLAAFLSDSPFLWFAPDPSARSQDRDADVRAGGIGARDLTLGADDALPAALIETLRQRHSYRRRESDLVRGGVIMPSLAVRSRG